MPPRDSRGQHRAIQPSRELLQSRKQRFCAHNDRQCLDESDRGVRFYGGNETDDAIASNQTWRLKSACNPASHASSSANA